MDIMSHMSKFSTQSDLKKKSAQKKHPMLANLTKTIERLTSYLQATYQASDQSKKNFKSRKHNLSGQHHIE